MVAYAYCERGGASRMQHRASALDRFPSIAMRLFPLFAASAAIVLIAGCKTAPPSAPVAANGSAAPSASGSQVSPRQPAPSPATKAASTKAHLAIEKLRLAELFRGTPVLFALQPDGSMRVDVPLNFSFDAGKAVVKPPLAAVLDRVAAGQLQEVTQIVVRAPTDAAAKSTTLLGERGASVRDYLVARGLADTRVIVSGPAGAAVVRLVVTDSPAP
jgi:outer membrane protein OmpA-like peptidoglycan-associated protein